METNHFNLLPGLSKDERRFDHYYMQKEANVFVLEGLVDRINYRVPLKRLDLKSRGNIKRDTFKSLE